MTEDRGDALVTKLAREMEQLEAMVAEFDLSGRLPEGLVFDLEARGTQPKLKVNEDFNPDQLIRAQHLVWLSKFWGAMRPHRRAQVQRAK